MNRLGEAFTKIPVMRLRQVKIKFPAPRDELNSVS